MALHSILSNEEGKYSTRDFRFSQWYCCRFKSSGT